MKLYAIAGSPNSRKVLAIVNHLNMQLDVQYLDLFKAEHKEMGYLAINPNGKVPALVDGDLKLWESNAIMQYLANKAEDDLLYPANNKLRADINKWQCWELAHFNQVFGTLAFESVAKPVFLKQEGNIAVIDWCKEKLVQYAGVLNSHLKNQDFMVADRITLADYSMIHVEFFKEQVPFDWSEFVHLNTYFERMRSLPQWASTAPKHPSEIGRVPASHSDMKV